MEFGQFMGQAWPKYAVNSQVLATATIVLVTHSQTIYHFLSQLTADQKPTDRFQEQFIAPGSIWQIRNLETSCQIQVL